MEDKVDASFLSEIVGVYHAKGTIFGELSYIIGKVALGRSCSLCDISHSGLSEKPQFEKIRKSLGVSFTTVHLDERSDDLAKFSSGKTPCVAGKLKETGRWIVLLKDEELESCKKDVGTFESKLKSAIIRERNNLGKSSSGTSTAVVLVPAESRT